MNKEKLVKLVNVASGKIKADTVIKNTTVVDVFTGKTVSGDVAISDDLIAGVGKYEGEKEIDGTGLYAVPGFIDSHIHVESSYLCPEELGRLFVPHGTTTIVADPHEIVNVCGLKGLDYMIEASKGTDLKIEYMLPSCVPATPFEHSGAVINAKDMEEPLKEGKVLGLGEFMNFPGVVNADSEVMDKILMAKKYDCVIDGHAPGLTGEGLNAYASAGIKGDHECSTVEEMNDRIRCGMYVLLRQGSACHNLESLIPGITPENSRRCLLCSDDRQPKTILNEGHIDYMLKTCVSRGVDAVTAIRMATLNAAECFGLKDRGAIAPGYKADITLLENLNDFKATKVLISGEIKADSGKYVGKFEKHSIDAVKESMVVKNFSKDRLKLKLKSDKVNTIEIVPGGVLTKKTVSTVKLDNEGCFVFDPDRDIVKMAVVERHQGTGNVALGLLKGYGIKKGAIALSIAHDSHNIITVGVSDDEMTCAVNELIRQEGGIVIVENGKVVESMPMPIAGLMSDKDGYYVSEKLKALHDKAYECLKVSGDVEPVMTLCFMSLAVIPELKLTDMGLFDVTTFSFIDIEA